KENATHTIGVEFGSRIVAIGKNQVKLQIWDTRNSFMSISKWIADARKLAGADIALMLVGNKLDLEDREVTYLEASRFAQEN
ncbi:Ras- protein Rab-4A, partial [Entomortierella lignicola]